MYICVYRYKPFKVLIYPLYEKLFNLPGPLVQGPPTLPGQQARQRSEHGSRTARCARIRRQQECRAASEHSSYCASDMCIYVDVYLYKVLVYSSEVLMFVLYLMLQRIGNCLVSEGASGAMKRFSSEICVAARSWIDGNVTET